MVHDDVYPPDRIDDALTHYFRPGSLNALRKLALLWMAGPTEEAQDVRHDHPKARLIADRMRCPTLGRSHRHAAAASSTAPAARGSMPGLLPGSGRSIPRSP